MGAINLLFLPIYQLSRTVSPSAVPMSLCLSENRHISIIARKCTHTVHTH